MTYPLYLWTAYGLHPVSEFRFAPPRRWRFDFAFVDQKVAVEIDGGAWTYGRHNRGSGFIKDMEKMNRAVQLGWRVFRFIPSQVKTGEAQQFMKGILSRL